MRHLEGGAWDVDARAEREDDGETIDERLAEVDGDIVTIGGLSAVLAGHRPKVGNSIVHDSGWMLEVIAADGRRVLSMRLPPSPSPGPNTVKPRYSWRSADVQLKTANLVSLS